MPKLQEGDPISVMALAMIDTFGARAGEVAATQLQAARETPDFISDAWLSIAQSIDDHVRGQSGK